MGYGLRQYLYATGDTVILQNEHGIDLALEIARYWKSRSTKTGKDVYEILGKSFSVKNKKNHSLKQLTKKDDMFISAYGSV